MRARIRCTFRGIPPRPSPTHTPFWRLYPCTVAAAYVCITFVHRHAQVSMCQAKLVGPLITLTHSDVENVSDAGGNVLKLLA